jgi:hypothetical protein
VASSGLQVQRYMHTITNPSSAHGNKHEDASATRAHALSVGADGTARKHAHSKGNAGNERTGYTHLVGLDALNDSLLVGAAAAVRVLGALGALRLEAHGCWSCSCWKMHLLLLLRAFVCENSVTSSACRHPSLHHTSSCHKPHDVSSSSTHAHDVG